MPESRVIFRLSRTLWVRSLRANPSAVIIAVLMALYAFIAGVSLGSMAAMDGRGEAFVAGTALGISAYVLLALVMPSAEGRVDVSTLSTLPLTPRQVLPGVAVASLLNTRVFLAAFCTVAWAVLAGAMTGRPVAFALGSVLAWATTVVLGELVAKAGAVVLNAKNNVLMAVSGLVGSVLMVLVLNLQDAQLPLDVVGRVAAWTPLGAATGWAVAPSLGVVAGQLLIAVATLVAAAAAWVFLVRRELDAPRLGEGSAGRARRRAFGIPGLSYRGPGAMEYTRSLRYLARDSRLLASLFMLPVMLAYIFWQLATGKPEVAAMFTGVLGIFAGLIAANDIGYDGPSSWVKLAAPVRPRVFLAARHLAHLTVPLLAQAAAAVALVTMWDNRPLAAASAAIGFGVFLSAAAFGLLFTTFNAYPTSAPGTNPWTDKSGYAAAPMIAGMLTLFFGWLPAAPGIVLIFFGHHALGGALAIAVPAVLYAGVVWGCSRRIDATYPEVYAKVRTWVS